MRMIKYFLSGLMIIVFSSAGFAADTVKIAAIFALTGKAGSNVNSMEGVRFGVKEINRQGGVMGKQLELLEYDNHSSAIRSNVAAENAARAGAAAIVGPAWSSFAIAAARAAQAQKIPMITNIATNPKVTRIGDYIFRACYVDDFQGDVMAQFARRDLNAETAVVCIDLTSDYSMGLAAVFKKRFEQLGGRILMELKYKYKQKNYNNLIEQIQKTKSDVIFIPGHDESGRILKEAFKAGMESIPLGGDGWGAESFLEKGGARLNKGYYCDQWSGDITSAISQKFVRNFHGDLFSGAALGYDAVFLLADAIRRAGAPDRGKIREALAATRGFEGVTGTIAFDADGDPIKNAVIMTIENGRPRYLKTFAP